jgi:tripartite-type tricarboxylate transporter receptor subunit TctC
MIMFRRSMGLALSMLLCAGAAWAQSYPNKPIRILVPFAAGGVADQTMRAIAPRLGEALGQSIVVDNRPSAGGIVAGEAVAKAEADGHTLLLMSNGTAVSSSLFKSLPFDAQKDFAPISTLGSFDIALVASEDGRFKTVQELLAFARSNPGKLNIGTINIGSTQNLAAELIKSAAGIDVQIVPFRSSPDVVMALRGGTVDAAVEILGPLMGQINSKAVRPLAVLGDKRAAKLAAVPTLAEAGVQGASASSWNALAAPANTPREVIAKINQAVALALSDAAVKARLAELNVEAQASTPAALGALLASETRRWSEVINKAKIDKQ